MQILIGADFVPTESNYKLFAEGNTEALFGKELKDCLDAAEYRIFNLEVPLVDIESPIAKCGPNLIAPTATVNAYKAAGVDLLTLANNHAFDQGLPGLLSTCETLKEKGIAYVGAGLDLKEAAAPRIVVLGGKRIGIYACCEHEFGFAEAAAAGANPFDPLESLDHISALKATCDYVIVLYHGGKEYYRYPSPLLQKTCRKIVEKGADLVVCQHSHCVGCEEKYKGATIVYGQGNFLFDRRMNECWDAGLLVGISENLEISYIPLVKQDEAVRLASGETARQIMEGFSNRSEKIASAEFVKKKYEEFSASMLQRYLFSFSGSRRTFARRVLDKLTGQRMTPWQLKRKYTDEVKLAVQNFIACEAHRELLLCGLENANKKRQEKRQ